MVLGDPEAVVAEGLGDPGQPGGVGEGIGRRGVLGHGGEVEHRQRGHAVHNTVAVPMLPDRVRRHAGRPGARTGRSGYDAVTIPSIRSSVFVMLSAVFFGSPPSFSRARWWSWLMSQLSRTSVPPSTGSSS